MLPTFRRSLQHCILTLGFLTRLAPPRMAGPEAFAGSICWFPPAGLFFGSLLVTPFALGLGKNAPAVQAFLYTLLNAWLTRGLHLDGVADLADALGSLKDTNTFWRVLKDSRIGAFGCMALIFAISGQIILAYPFFSATPYVPLVLPFFWSRSALFFFIVLVPSSPHSTLARLFQGNRGFFLPVLWLGLCWATTLVVDTLTGACLALFFTLFFSFSLRHIAQKAGGMNGDFLGALVCLTELGTLVALIPTIK